MRALRWAEVHQAASARCSDEGLGYMCTQVSAPRVATVKVLKPLREGEGV